MNILYTFILVALVACRTAGEVSEPKTRPAVEDAAPPTVSRALQHFVATVDLVSAEPGGFHRSRLVSALHSLADALPDLAGGREVAARSERIRFLADELQKESAGSRAEARTAKAGLTQAAGALEEVAHALGVETARAAHGRALEAIERMDDSRPLLRQALSVRAALAEVANGLLLARGLEPAVDPVGAAPQEAIPDGARPGDAFLASALEASGLVARLSLETGRGARSTAAAALDAFAAALESLASRSDDMERRISTIRFEARRLRTESVVTFHESRWTRAGLEAAIEGLAASRPAGPSEEWIQRARAAARNIDENGLFALQRARVQEAFRTAADGFLFVARDSRSSAPSSTGGPGSESMR